METLKPHYVDKYIRDPHHRLTIGVFGVGGTGSFLLSKIARLNVAMKKIYDYPGLHVKAYDYDIIEEHNYIRSTFSPADAGQPKASTIIARINRYYGLKWQGVDRKFDTKVDHAPNIVFLCVDTLSARNKIMKAIEIRSSYHHKQYFYCIDAGNNDDHGQIIVSSNHKEEDHLPYMWELFPDVKEDKTESCSIQESLKNQNIFINEAMAVYAAEILKSLITNPVLDFNTVFINLSELSSIKAMINYEPK